VVVVLDQSERAWTSVGLREFGAFMQSLRGASNEANVAATFKPAVAETTVAARVRAVLSRYRYRYRYHAACGGPSVDHLFVQGSAMPRSYLPFLTHIARRHPQQRSLVKVRVRRSELPIAAVEPRPGCQSRCCSDNASPSRMPVSSSSDQNSR
jgi:hypothetical protein